MAGVAELLQGHVEQVTGRGVALGLLVAGLDEAQHRQVTAHLAVGVEALNQRLLLACRFGQAELDGPGGAGAGAAAHPLAAVGIDLDTRLDPPLVTGDGVGGAYLQAAGAAEVARGGVGAEVGVDLEVAGLVELPHQFGELGQGGVAFRVIPMQVAIARWGKLQCQGGRAAEVEDQVGVATPQQRQRQVQRAVFALQAHGEASQVTLDTQGGALDGGKRPAGQVAGAGQQRLNVSVVGVGLGGLGDQQGDGGESTVGQGGRGPAHGELVAQQQRMARALVGDAGGGQVDRPGDATASGFARGPIGGVIHGHGVDGRCHASSRFTVRMACCRCRIVLCATLNNISVFYGFSLLSNTPLV